jgi:hypothetical protein
VFDQRNEANRAALLSHASFIPTNVAAAIMAEEER